MTSQVNLVGKIKTGAHIEKAKTGLKFLKFTLEVEMYNDGRGPYPFNCLVFKEDLIKLSSQLKKDAVVFVSGRLEISKGKDIVGYRPDSKVFCDAISIFSQASAGRSKEEVNV